MTRVGASITRLTMPPAPAASLHAQFFQLCTLALLCTPAAPFSSSATRSDRTVALADSPHLLFSCTPCGPTSLCRMVTAPWDVPSTPDPCPSSRRGARNEHGAKGMRQNGDVWVGRGRAETCVRPQRKLSNPTETGACNRAARAQDRDP